MTRLKRHILSLHERLLNEGWTYLGDMVVGNGDAYRGILGLQGVGSRSFVKPMSDDLHARYSQLYRRVRVEDPHIMDSVEDYRAVYVRGKKK